jgi:hypothetical protein
MVLLCAACSRLGGEWLGRAKDPLGGSALLGIDMGEAIDPGENPSR